MSPEPSKLKIALPFGSPVQGLILGFVLCCAVALLVSLFARPFDFLGGFTLGAGLFIVLLIARTNVAIAIPILLAFTIRGLLAFFNANVAPLLDSQNDAVAFETLAWQWSEAGQSTVVDLSRTGPSLYAWLISLLYTVTDRSPLMIQGVNVLLGTLIVWNVYRTAWLLWGQNIAVRSAWMIALFPTLLLYSSIILREVATVYPLTLAIYYLVKWDQGNAIRHIFLVAIFGALATAFHSVSFILLLFASMRVLGDWFTKILQRRGRDVLRRSISLLIIVGIVVAIYSSGWALEKIGGGFGDLYFERIVEVQSGSSTGRAAYLSGFSPDKPMDLVWQGPIRAVFFLFAPFPWDLELWIDGLGFLDAALWSIMSVGLICSLRRILANRSALLILVILVGMTVPFATGVSNYGTAIRHRAKLIPLAVTLLVVVPGFADGSLPLRGLIDRRRKKYTISDR
jgi:hypothetical protein